MIRSIKRQCLPMDGQALFVINTVMNKSIKNILLLTLVFTSCVTIAFADGEAAVRSAVYNIYIVIRNVASAMCVVGIAGCAIQILAGNTNNASKAYSRLIAMLLAIGALWLVPFLLSYGKDLLGAGAWDPANL